MADFGDELEEIEALLLSGVKSNKKLAYPTLLHLQERYSTAGGDKSSIGMVAQRSQSLLNLMIEDVFDDDEEIAAQACKCLGFMLYHPSIVATISADVAGPIIQSLAKLIINTKMKSVCNLGVWCISIQQLDASFLHAHFDVLMMAVAHALDNPAGSLSTTFEAVQAILKLASQLYERMKQTSNVWAPPLYRRLISELKKERDLSERCLMSLKSIVNPPIPTLAKVVIRDMNKKLLPGLKELQSKGFIIQAIQAWGWFVSLIGPYSTQNRCLLNEMLSFIEHTFTDHRPQVQIASLVVWERLIDALLNHPLQACDLCVFMDKVDQESRTSLGKHGSNSNGFFKSIKLLMTPLIGIISSKCDTSVQSACMKAWCYLLHKLGTYINCPAVLDVTVEPLLKAVFRMRANNGSNWLLNLCIDILDDSISAKYKIGGIISSEQLKPSMNCVPAECLRKQYPLKWLPWGISQLEFYTDMVQVLSNQGVLMNITPEYRSLVIKSTMRIYRSILKGINVEMKNSAHKYDQITRYLTTTLQLIEKLFEDATSGETAIEKLELPLCIIGATLEELELSILDSPLYRVKLDISRIQALSADKVRGREAEDVYNYGFGDITSHLVYLAAIYFSLFTKVLLISDKELIIQKFESNFKLLVYSDNSLGVFQVILSIMYGDPNTCGLKTWVVIATVIKDIIGGSGDVFRLKLEHDRTGYLLALCFLSYPLFICASLLTKASNLSCKGGTNTSPTYFSEVTDLDHVVLEWRSIFYLFKDASKSDLGATRCFVEDLCTTMNQHLQTLEGNNGFEPINSHQEDVFHCIIGEMVICVIDKVKQDTVSSNDIKVIRGSISLRNTLAFVASYIQVGCSLKGTYQSTPHDVTTRVFMALSRFVSCLHQRQEVTLLIEVLHDCLLDCLSHDKSWNGSNQLQVLWNEILNSLQRAQPPFVITTSLNHPNPSISEPTIKFWNLTYGKQLQVDYPQCILSILDKLSKAGKVCLFNPGAEVLQKCHAVQHVYNSASTSGTCMVSTMHNRGSKRITLVEQDTWGPNCAGPNRKRRRWELTDHQKEVRRAQQGKERDCNGHGPGVRTYTSLDFSQSQTNEDSQELEDISLTESILEMLKRPQ